MRTAIAVMRVAASGILVLCAGVLSAAELQLSAHDTFEARGLSVLLHHNAAHGVFFDQKLSGLEIIQHGERIATNGDVRLLPTPEQWDPIARFKERKREGAARSLTAFCDYPDRGLSYRVEVTAEADGFRVVVHLDQPLAEALVGRVGFNLEFLPSAYFGKSYLLDAGSGVFPRHPQGPMERDGAGEAQPQPMATGRRLVLSPEDPSTRVTIESDTGALMLFDGRNRAQNGWFVVRSLIPAQRTENALVWHVRPNAIAGWTRPPVIGHNQVGYTPNRSKLAVIELDPLFEAPRTARVLRILPNGDQQEALRGEIRPWGRWLRYQYAHFDFSAVRAPGVYAIEYAGQRTGPFRIAEDVYRRGVWQPALDTFLPVQMDHMRVREGYRIWHGASHLDDARQAPANHVHFDGYAMGPTTDSPFAAGEHIPGLDRGGWYDAGDFDIRTQTQAQVIVDLVMAHEHFDMSWDETTVDQQARLVLIRRPDGRPDVLQQIEHGVLALLAQYRTIGHAIPGIVEPTLEQYTHLGDGASKTDNRIHAPQLGALETDGLRSGVPDDRWAFTNRASALEYAAVAALAAASRALRGFNDELAQECLATAERAWREEHQRPPALFRAFNTTGGALADEEAQAAVELLLATSGAEPYRSRLAALSPTIRERFGFVGWTATRAIPFMGPEFRAELEGALRAFKQQREPELARNPFGVPIAPGAWGGAHLAALFSAQSYFLHRAFPDLVERETALRGLDYLLGTHPVSDVSLVSAVGARSQLVAYGNNRADYSFIPGGLTPGMVVVQPDFPEIKDGWPFLWFENEYVVDTATAFILAAHAADAVAD